MSVTPEMIQAGKGAVDLFIGRPELTSIYIAMKAVDPEVERLRVALGTIRDGWADSAREAMAIADNAISQTQSQAREQSK